MVSVVSTSESIYRNQH